MTFADYKLHQEQQTFLLKNKLYLSGDKSSVFGATYMAEAALVLALRGSARMLLAVLRLGFGVLLKPAQNKVSQQPCQQQNAERF